MNQAMRFTYLVNRALVKLGLSWMSFSSYYLMAQPITADRFLPPHRGRNIEVRRIERGDAVLEKIHRPATEIEERYRGGAICFGAMKNDKLVGFLWFMPGPYREPEDRCVVTPMPDGSAVWDLDVFIDPSERMGFAFARLWDECNAYLYGRGYRWTLSRISAFNPGSMTAHGRLAARQMGKMNFLTIGPVQLMWCTIPPFFHLSFKRDRAPVVAVHAPSGSGGGGLPT